MSRHPSATKMVSEAAWLRSLITATVVIEVLLATASNAGEDPAAAADTDWGCASAAAQYQYLDDARSVPTTPIDGDYLAYFT